MKKYVLTLFIIFGILSTAVYAAPVDPYAHHEHFDNMDKDFFEKIISGEEATCMICLHRDTTKKYLDEKTANKIFFDSVYNWLNKTKKYILDDKAENNFQDILVIIENVNIKTVPCEVDENDKIVSDNADILVFFTEDMQASTHLEIPEIFEAIFIPESGDIIIQTLPTRKYDKYVGNLTHELGHAFGLADQYLGATYKSSFWYNSNIKRPSIMDRSDHITCDDIDGFITTIDRLKGTKREFYSLCNDGLFIKDGRGVMKADQSYDFYDNYKDFNAFVVIHENKNAPNTLIMDMTLRNFVLSEDGLSLVKNMGFEINDYKTLKNIEIRVHGSIIEKPYEMNNVIYPKTPVGLWHWSLSVKRGGDYKLKKIIYQEFVEGEKQTPELLDLDTDERTVLSDKIIIPLIEYYPKVGDGEKEKIREAYVNRYNPFWKIDNFMKKIGDRISHR